MTRLLVSGYSNFELGIFSPKDERLKVIRAVIKKDLIDYLNDGLEWLVFSGNLGFEYWVLEEALLLRQSYRFNMACILPFEEKGLNWSEANQEKLAKFKGLDFVKAAYASYTHPRQFKVFNQFLIDHTDQAYLFYDREQPSKLSYLEDLIKAQKDYHLKTLTFESLNNFAQNF